MFVFLTILEALSASLNGKTKSSSFTGSRDPFEYKLKCKKTWINNARSLTTCFQSRLSADALSGGGVARGAQPPGSNTRERKLKKRSELL